MFRGRINQRGFSLLEVLITVIVLGIGLVSLARFQGVVLQDSSLARQRSEAASYLQQQMENYRSFNALAGVGNTYSNITTTQAGYIVDNSLNTTFTRRSTLVTANCPVTLGSLCINTQITWPSRTGLPDSDTTLGLTGIIAGTDPSLSGNNSAGGSSGGIAPPANHDQQATKCVAALDGLSLICT